MFKKTLVLISLVLVMLVIAVPAMAFDTQLDCVDYVDINGTTVCFLGNADNGDGTVTWTYAIQQNSSPALSHVTFSICIDDPITVTPGHGDTYTTPGLFGSVFGVGGVEYNVVVDGTPDPKTGVNGIKFEDGTAEMGIGDVHIFQFTQALQTNPGTEPTPVGVKAGGLDEAVLIQGPICGGTSSVDLTQFSASGGLFARVLSWLGLR